MLTVRVEFERDFDAKKPNHLLIKKMISKDMEFYRGVLFNKLKKRLDIELIKPTDTLLVYYNSKGKRNLSVTAENDTVAKAIQDGAEGVFPNNYKHAKS